MKLGETITHNGIEAVLVKGWRCENCCFDMGRTELNCIKEGLVKGKCLSETMDDDDGIFKQVEPKEKGGTKMSWVVVDGDGREYVYANRPSRENMKFWAESDEYVPIPKGSIKKLIDRDLTWESDPVELKEAKFNT